MLIFDRNLPHMERCKCLMERCMKLVELGDTCCRDVCWLTFRNENKYLSLQKLRLDVNTFECTCAMIIATLCLPIYTYSRY